MVSEERNTHTHTSGEMLVVLSGGWLPEREGGEGKLKNPVTHRRCMAAGFSTYYNGRSTFGPFALVVPKFNDSPFMKVK